MVVQNLIIPLHVVQNLCFSFHLAYEICIFLRMLCKIYIFPCMLCEIHSWAQRKLSPLNILLLINGPLLSLGFNGFND